MDPSSLNFKTIRRIIFDLDDTLFDTFNLLVAPAALESCQAMVRAGLDATVEEALKIRKKFVSTRERKDIFKKITAHFGVKPGKSEASVTSAGFNAFHNREIREEIQVFSDARETLEKLGEKYTLYLVTMGGLETQSQKIERLKIADYFSKIIYVDITKEKNKKAAFQRILNHEKDLTPAEFLSVGNRIDSEIRDAKELGMKTALIAHGEHSHLIAENENEKPDIEISQLKQLLEFLR